MSDDSFSVVTSQSWFSRIGGAIKGVLVGLLLVVVSFPLLFWNEGRAVKTYQTLKEGAGAVVSVNSDRIDPANEGKLVHAKGAATTEEALTDTEFAVSTPALVLQRSVEMYQWKESSEKETHKKLGGGEETRTTYNYAKAWSSSLIDSSDFKKPDGHRNPDRMPVAAAERVAQHARLGAFALPAELVGRLSDFVDLPVAAAPEALPNRAKPHQGGFYLGADPAVPQIGDTRVHFRQVPPGNLSVIARQLGDTFGPYTAKTGKTIEMIRGGLAESAEMFAAAQAENTLITWLLRLGGFVLMFLGWTLVFRPLSVLADVVPFIGSLVGMGTGLVAFLIALIGSLLTIAVAWIAYRPVLAILLLAGVVGVVFLVRSRSRPAPLLKT